MSRDLLLEIGTEELPAWYVSEGSVALGEALRSRLSDEGLEPASVEVYGTPRRLAVLARGVPEASASRAEERRGPSSAVAFDESGRPTKAAEAFARGAGVGVADLERKQTERGEYVFATVRHGGEATPAVLARMLPSLVSELPAPRKMRWSTVATPFIRPVAWLTALFGREPIAFEAAGVASGPVSRGHRFLAPGEVAVASPDDYVQTLEEAMVIASEERRRSATWAAVGSAASELGLSAVPDEALLAEVTNLVEWPFPIAGRFDEAYLELPDAVLATVMVKHQRFFPLARDGRLANAFVGVSNNDVPDKDVVRRGYEEVLAGRLYDARFFWRADKEKTLSQHAWSLSGIAFQRELGSMADKVARVTVAADAMADAVALAAAEREALAGALPLFRADLATQMVYEFPELEGTMAKAYALEEGLSGSVAAALEGGTLPKGPDSLLPPTEAGAVLAVADRLDKLVGFFAIGKRPSGSADPFGLRRDAHAVVRVLAARGWRTPVDALVEAAASAYRGSATEVDSPTLEAVSKFLWDRVSALLEERGHGAQVVKAAVEGSLTVLGALRRARLLTALMTRDEFSDLMALFKRAANLVSAADVDPNALDPQLFAEPQERPLADAAAAAGSAAAELMEAVTAAVPPHDPGGAAGAPELDPATLTRPLERIVALRAPLDAFLDGVHVMAEDERLRTNRLALLEAVVVPLERLGALEHLT